MKKLALLIAVFIALIAQGIKGQNLIAVQNGGTASFYTNLDVAISNAQNGDTIYLPGGIFPISVSINKTLHIIGVGHNPDSTLATLYTYIYGNINIDANGSNGSLTGISISGSIISNNNVTNFLVKRCVFNGLNLTSSTISWIFIENVIRGWIKSNTQPGASDCLFANNIIDGFMGYYNSPGFTNCIFRNNDFFAIAYGGGSYGWVSALISPYSTIENNIFHGGSDYYTVTGNSSNSIFYNNLFVSSWNPPTPSISANNITNQAANSIFINQAGDNFSYTHNYHLQTSCLGRNAGTDGTDIGIYGGAYPWKDGSIPFNPHFQSVNISPTTNSSGNLDVIIKVASQDR